MFTDQCAQAPRSASLQVYPVASAVPYAKSAGARVVILNAQPTPFDKIADAVLSSSISEILPQLVPPKS